MSKYEQVLRAIRTGMRFSWNLDGIDAFKEAKKVHTLTEPLDGAIGWLLQEFAKKAIYNPDLFISFEPTAEGINVYYETDINP